MTRRMLTSIAAVVLLAAATLLPAPGANAANIVGSSGADVIFGTNRADRILAGSGADFLFGKAGADRLFGESGNDTIFGGGGADILDGGPQNDVIYDDDSTPGDRVRGRDGNDTLLSIDGAADRVNCGAGIDTAYIDRGADVVAECETVVTRNGDVGEFRVRIGTNGSDSIRTGDVRNLIFGRAARDSLRAGEKDDVVLGGGGGDSYRGEEDEDVHIDDDSQSGDGHRPGDGDDVVFTVDGARDSVDCSGDGDTGDDDIVFADKRDGIIDCGTVFRG